MRDCPMPKATFIELGVYMSIWQENLFEKRPFNFHKSGSANGCPLLKLLSNALVSFTSCCDLDLYHSEICRQLLVDLTEVLVLDLI